MVRGLDHGLEIGGTLPFGIEFCSVISTSNRLLDDSFPFTYTPVDSLKFDTTLFPKIKLRICLSSSGTLILSLSL